MGACGAETCLQNPGKTVFAVIWVFCFGVCGLSWSPVVKGIYIWTALCHVTGRRCYSVPQQVHCLWALWASVETSKYVSIGNSLILARGTWKRTDRPFLYLNLNDKLEGGIFSPVVGLRKDQPRERLPSWCSRTLVSHFTSGHHRFDGIYTFWAFCNFFAPQVKKYTFRNEILGGKCFGLSKLRTSNQQINHGKRNLFFPNSPFNAHLIKQGLQFWLLTKWSM